MSVSTFRPDIQGLRAVAVVLVILAHARITGFDGGYIGVDVFFVISGFVITSLLLRQPDGQILHNLRNFYARRIMRIMPAATVVLMAMPIAAYLIQGFYFDPQILIDVRWATFFSANFQLINSSTGYFIEGIDPALITHFWSLAVEEQFYLFYPLFFFGFSAIAVKFKNRGFILLAIFTGILISAWYSAQFTAIDPLAAYYSPLTRFWELALGGLVATLPSRLAPPNRKIGTAVSIAAAIALVFAVANLNARSAFPGVLAWWPTLATALLIWAGSNSDFSKILSLKPIRYIGDISYSLYLWHFPWLVLPIYLEQPLSQPVLIGILGAFICAVISYHWLENPIRHSKRLYGDGWAVLILLLVCLALSYDTTLILEYLYLQG